MMGKRLLSDTCYERDSGNGELFSLWRSKKRTAILDYFDYLITLCEKQNLAI